MAAQAGAITNPVHAQAADEIEPRQAAAGEHCHIWQARQFLIVQNLSFPPPAFHFPPRVNAPPVAPVQRATGPSG